MRPVFESCEGSPGLPFLKMEGTNPSARGRSTYPLAGLSEFLVLLLGVANLGAESVVLLHEFRQLAHKKAGVRSGEPIEKWGRAERV